MSKYFIYIKIKLLNYSCMTFLEKLKIKLQNFGKNNQLLLLDILDFLVDKGNMNIWSAISSKKFFQGLLNLLKTKDIPEEKGDNKKNWNWQSRDRLSGKKQKNESDISSDEIENMTVSDD